MIIKMNLLIIISIIFFNDMTWKDNTLKIYDI